MRVRSNFTTERLGLNYARNVVEGAGSIFKETNLQHDYGHDATVMLVTNGQVQPREVALQVKSGSSYVVGEICRIPAGPDHIHFWAEHDLVTLGVVYDPAAAQAYWVDLQTASREFRRHNKSAGTTFLFPKSLWNRFDNEQFALVLLPTLLGKAPLVALETLMNWVNSSDIETHELGVRAIRARHFKSDLAWDCLIQAFKSRPLKLLSMEIGLALSKLLGHDDLGYYSGEIPNDIRVKAVAAVLKFEAPEIVKVLGLIQDGMFDRPSDGYSLLPILAGRTDSVEIWKTVRDDECVEMRIREYAEILLEWYTHEPEWFQLWRRDK